LINEASETKSKRNEPDFGIKQGAAKGEIILTSLSGKIDSKPVPTTYNWQCELMTPTGMVVQPS
jgi:hypothetical protein